MKFKYLYISVLPLLTAVLLFSAFFMSGGNEAEAGSNDKIIKFSHSFHAELAECKECHTQAAESTSLKDRMMPDHESCKSCHDVEDDKTCNTCHYEDTFEPLIQKESSNLMFNHKAHVADRNINCEACHKGISKVDYAFQAEQPYPAMADCYTCHSETKVASNACESCHISTSNLMPQNHRSASFMKTHKFAAKEMDANCIMCHDNSNNSCEDCHAANNIITEINLPKDFYTPYAPTSSVDGAKRQKVNRVHDLNYRFTHGIDAKSGSMECQSCHETETFCATCHQAEGHDFSMGGTVPASHLKPDFITIGRGTGGGEHAILAKRDIEDCTSCHDVNGADPTCITCHLDNDGIKGTNPKTHPAGFMHSEHGDWHDNSGSVCYNCHTVSVKQAGLGFCGYCHGSKVE